MATAYTPQQIRWLINNGHGQLVKKYCAALTPLELFQPRPDIPEEYDEQTAFLESTAKFAVCLGGTGSGKTHAAAVKTARYVLNTRPPRSNCPFWIVGDTFEQVCAVCWDEKLCDLIPRDKILSIDWHKTQRNWPNAVTLKHPDNPKKRGWSIEFKSYSQGRQHMQGRSIGGYWLNEECPLEIVREVQGRCRDYDSPGWADFTPIAVISPEWPDLYDKPPTGWKFFHLNVEKNQYIEQEWIARYLASIPEEERETRRIGVFASFAGQVFKEFRNSIHVLDPETEGPNQELAEKLDSGDIPDDWKRIRGIDWGYSNPLACMWVARDRDGRYYVYDEHYEAQKPNSFHVARIQERPWNDKHPLYGGTFCDTADPQQMVEFTKLGVRCQGANKGIGQYPVLSRISFLRSLMMVQGDLRPKFYVLAKCKNLIRELRGYRWSNPTGSQKNNNQKNAQNCPVDWDNHALDAMGYACFSDAHGTGRAPTAVARLWQPRESVRVAMPVRR